MGEKSKFLSDKFPIRSNMYFLLILFFLLLSPCFSQDQQTDAVDLESRLCTWIPGCNTISSKSMSVINRLYIEGKVDSIQYVLDFWEDNCGRGYYINPIIILHAIMKGSFNDPLYDSTFFKHDARFQYFYKNRLNIDSIHRPQNTNSSEEFERFEAFIADSLSKVLDTNTLEYLFSLYYSYKFEKFYTKLRDESAFIGSKLKRYYETEIKKIKSYHNIGWRAGLIVGAWIPFGKWSVFGSHPELGGFFGARSRKLYADANVVFKFFESRKPIQITSNDTLFNTRFSWGWIMGVDLGLEIARFYKNQFDFFFGFGLENIKWTSDLKYTPLFLISPGISYRFYPGRKRLSVISFQLRYSLFDKIFSTQEETKVKGNAIIGRLIFSLSEYTEDERLVSMGYFNKKKNR